MAVSRMELELLTRILGLEGQRIQRVELEEASKELHIWLEPPAPPYRGPHCGKPASSLHDRRERAVRDKPWADNAVWVHLPILRIRCCQGATPIELPLPLGIKKTAPNREDAPAHPRAGRPRPGQRRGALAQDG